MLAGRIWIIAGITLDPSQGVAKQKLGPFEDYSL